MSRQKFLENLDVKKNTPRDIELLNKIYATFMEHVVFCNANTVFQTPNQINGGLALEKAMKQIPCSALELSYAMQHLLKSFFSEKNVTPKSAKTHLMHGERFKNDTNNHRLLIVTNKDQRYLVNPSYQYWTKALPLDGKIHKLPKGNFQATVNEEQKTITIQGVYPTLKKDPDLLYVIDDSHNFVKHQDLSNTYSQFDHPLRNVLIVRQIVNNKPHELRIEKNETVTLNGKEVKGDTLAKKINAGLKEFPDTVTDALKKCQLCDANQAMQSVLSSLTAEKNIAHNQDNSSWTPGFFLKAAGAAIFFGAAIVFREEIGKALFNGESKNSGPDI